MYYSLQSVWKSYIQKYYYFISQSPMSLWCHCQAINMYIVAGYSNNVTFLNLPIPVLLFYINIKYI